MPPTLLNSDQRLDVLEAIELGAGIETAARFAGCDAADITCTLDADPRFRRHYHRAEVQLEIECLRAVRLQGRNWRAAAWALERIYPDRYAPRKPTPGKSAAHQPTPHESQSPIDKNPGRPATTTDRPLTSPEDRRPGADDQPAAKDRPERDFPFEPLVPGGRGESKRSVNVGNNSSVDSNRLTASQPTRKTPPSAPAEPPGEPCAPAAKKRRSPPANAAELQQRALDFIDRRIAEIRAEIGQPAALDDLDLDVPDDNSHLAHLSIGGAPPRSNSSKIPAGQSPSVAEPADKPRAAASEQAVSSAADDALATVGAFSDSGHREHRPHSIHVGAPSTGPP